MYKLALKKPDGRDLTLYGRAPVQIHGSVPSPDATPVVAHPQMRWHPLRGEWVMYASHRQNRTFLPPPEYNPLAPTTNPQHPTELPQGTFDIAVFDNRFPSLMLEPPIPDPVAGAEVRAGVGKCEVVVFSQEATGSLGALPADHIRLLLDVWADRTTELGEDPRIIYVLPFENRGVEVGVTLHHPHGQIYAYDHLPPVQERAQTQMQAYLEQHGKPWLTDFIRQERETNVRVIRDEGLALSLVPPFARFTYETWVIPARPVAFLGDLNGPERDTFGTVLRDSLLRLDALFGVRMPYLLTIQQGPTDGRPHPEWPLRIEISPYLRAAGRLKYLAGTEQGAGEFVNDSLPEQKAAELKEVTVDI